MIYKRFEELPCWKAARELCRYINRLIVLDPFKKDFSLKDQLWRAAGSVMDNIAEGFDSDSVKEFRRFLSYSQRSSSEIQSQLYRALDSGYINSNEFEKAYQMAGECRKQIRGFRKYLKDYTSTSKDPN